MPVDKPRTTLTSILKAAAVVALAAGAQAPAAGTHPVTGEALSDDQSFTYRLLDQFPTLDPQLNEEVAGFHVIRELVYSDPPYVQSTRRSGRRYRFDYTDAEHVVLLGILKSLPCQVMSPAIRPGSTTRIWPAGARSRSRSTTGPASSLRSCGSTSSPTGCTGRRLPGGTSPTATSSSGRRRAGAAGTRRCPGPSGWRYWRR